MGPYFDAKLFYYVHLWVVSIMHLDVYNLNYDAYFEISTKERILPKTGMPIGPCFQIQICCIQHQLL